MRYLARLIGQQAAQAAVLSADWRKLLEFQPKVSPRCWHIWPPEWAPGREGAGETATQDFLQALLLAEPGDQSGLMEHHLQSLAARVFRIDREKVDVSQPLSALGLDSMMAMELKNRIELSLRIPVSVLDLLKGVSIGDLAQSMVTRLMEENPEYFTGSWINSEQLPDTESLAVSGD